MPVSVKSLLGVPALGLRMLVGRPGDETPLLWVHSSDLADPTPFLGADQMLLTTGTQFAGDGADPTVYASYVERLVRSGVRALGFGTEVVRSGTPARLVEACAEQGLPLVEVPYRTPFIAIIRWSADVIAEERHARDAWALKAQRAIALAALGPGGVSAALQTLSRELGRAVTLFDASGAVSERHTAPREGGAVVRGGGGEGGDARGAGGSGARLQASRQPDGSSSVQDARGERARVSDGLAAEVRRLLARETRASSTLVSPGTIVSLQTLGRSRRLRGVLAVSGEAELDRAERSVITSVVALVEVSREQSQVLDRGLRALNDEVLALLVDGIPASAAAARRVAAHSGSEVATAPLRVVVLASASLAAVEQLEQFARAASATATATAAAANTNTTAKPTPTAGASATARANVGALRLDESSEPASRSGHAFVATSGGSAVLLLPALGHDDAGAQLEALGIAASDSGLALGTAEADTDADLSAAIVRARNAAERQAASGSPGIRTAPSGGDSIAALIVDPQFAERATEILAPVAERADGVQLLSAAGVWLEHNGLWDPAARRLGMHRHSLRARIRLIESLLNLDLETFAGRAELWAMLSATGASAISASAISASATDASATISRRPLRRPGLGAGSR